MGGSRTPPAEESQTFYVNKTHHNFILLARDVQHFHPMYWYYSQFSTDPFGCNVYGIRPESATEPTEVLLG